MALLRLSRRALLAAELQHAEPKEATYRSPSKTLVPLTESNARLLNASATAVSWAADLSSPG